MTHPNLVLEANVSSPCEFADVDSSVAATFRGLPSPLPSTVTLFGRVEFSCFANETIQDWTITLGSNLDLRLPIGENIVVTAAAPTFSYRHSTRTVSVASVLQAGSGPRIGVGISFGLGSTKSAVVEVHVLDPINLFDLAQQTGIAGKGSFAGLSLPPGLEQLAQTLLDVGLERGVLRVSLSSATVRRLRAREARRLLEEENALDADKTELRRRRLPPLFLPRPSRHLQGGVKVQVVFSGVAKVFGASVPLSLDLKKDPGKPLKALFSVEAAEILTTLPAGVGGIFQQVPGMNNIHLGMATGPGEYTRWDFRDPGGAGEIVKLARAAPFILTAAPDLTTGFMQDVIQKTGRFGGAISATAGTVGLRASIYIQASSEIQIEIGVSSNVALAGITLNSLFLKFEMSLTNPAPQIGFGADVSIRAKSWTNPNDFVDLNFVANLRFEPATQTVLGMFTMTSATGWNNPMWLSKELTLNTLGIEMGISVSTGVPTIFKGVADAHWGAQVYSGAPIAAQVFLVVDLTDPANGAGFRFRLERFSLERMVVPLFSTFNLPPPTSPAALDFLRMFYLDKILVEVNPTPLRVVFANEGVDPGIALACEGVTFGGTYAGSAKFALQLKNLKPYLEAHLDLAPLNFGDALQLTGTNGGGPVMDIKIFGLGEVTFTLDGKARVFDSVATIKGSNTGLTNFNLKGSVSVARRALSRELGEPETELRLPRTARALRAMYGRALQSSSDIEFELVSALKPPSTPGFEFDVKLLLAGSTHGGVVLSMATKIADKAVAQFQGLVTAVRAQVDAAIANAIKPATDALNAAKTALYNARSSADAAIAAAQHEVNKLQGTVNWHQNMANYHWGRCPKWGCTCWYDWGQWCTCTDIFHGDCIATTYHNTQRDVVQLLLNGANGALNAARAATQGAVDLAASALNAAQNELNRIAAATSAFLGTVLDAAAATIKVFTDALVAGAGALEGLVRVNRLYTQTKLSSSGTLYLPLEIDAVLFNSKTIKHAITTRLNIVDMATQAFEKLKGEFEQFFRGRIPGIPATFRRRLAGRDDGPPLAIEDHVANMHEMLRLSDSSSSPDGENWADVWPGSEGLLSRAPRRRREQVGDAQAAQDAFFTAASAGNSSSVIDSAINGVADAHVFFGGGVPADAAANVSTAATRRLQEVANAPRMNVRVVLELTLPSGFGPFANVTTALGLFRRSLLDAGGPAVDRVSPDDDDAPAHRRMMQEFADAAGAHILAALTAGHATGSAAPGGSAGWMSAETMAVRARMMRWNEVRTSTFGRVFFRVDLEDVVASEVDHVVAILEQSSTIGVFERALADVLPSATLTAQVTSLRVVDPARRDVIVTEDCPSAVLSEPQRILFTQTPGPWGACNTTCGRGLRHRELRCSMLVFNDQTRTYDSRPSPDASMCAGLPATLPRSEPCAGPPCEAFQLRVSPLASTCSASCGGGSRARTRSCIASVSGEPAPLATCGVDVPDGVLVDLVTEACNEEACTDHVVRTGPWSACSASCGGGEQRRDVWCEDTLTGARVDDATCGGVSGQLAVSAVRPCNAAPCESHFWSSGPWSACSQNCSKAVPPSLGGGLLRGERSRSVWCGSTSGGRVAEELCDAALRPRSREACNTQMCDGFSICDSVECMNGGQCEEDANTRSGWICKCPTSGGKATHKGTYCETPASCNGTLVQTFAGSMTCCQSGVFTTAGTCCPGPSAAVDFAGTCCQTGDLDACGVCFGSGRSVDSLGTCCTGKHEDRDGRCCPGELELDDCGVCAGQNEGCSHVVPLEFDTPATLAGSALASAIATWASTALGVAESRITVPVLPDASGSSVPWKATVVVAPPPRGSGVAPLVQADIVRALSSAPTNGAFQRRFLSIFGALLHVGDESQQPTRYAALTSPIEGYLTEPTRAARASIRGDGLSLRRSTAVTLGVASPAGTALPTCGNGVCDMQAERMRIGPAGPSGGCLWDPSWPVNDRLDCEAPIYTCKTAWFAPERQCAGTGRCIGVAALTGVPDGAPVQMRHVAACECPEPYAGEACDECAVGFDPVPGSAQGGALLCTPSPAKLLVTSKPVLPVAEYTAFDEAGGAFTASLLATVLVLLPAIAVGALLTVSHLRMRELRALMASSAVKPEDGSARPPAPVLAWSGLTMAPQEGILMRLLRHMGVAEAAQSPLTDAWGRVESGTLAAVMSSERGARATLLEALAGHASGVVSGSRFLFSPGPAPLIYPESWLASGGAALVTAEDLSSGAAGRRLLDSQSVTDTLCQYCEMVMSASAPPAQKAARVKRVLAETHLAGHAAAKVGELCPGNRRLLSVAIALLSCPGVLFLTEPLEGLDAASALAVCVALKGIASSGKVTVLASVAQPRTDTLGLFDSCIVLGPHNTTVFAGPVVRAVGGARAVLTRGAHASGRTAALKFVSRNVNDADLLKDAVGDDAFLGAWATYPATVYVKQAVAAEANLNMRAAQAQGWHEHSWFGMVARYVDRTRTARTSVGPDAGDVESVCEYGSASESVAAIEAPIESKSQDTKRQAAGAKGAASPGAVQARAAVSWTHCEGRSALRIVAVKVGRFWRGTSWTELLATPSRPRASGSSSAPCTGSSAMPARRTSCTA
ncbi:unnamed protein product [Pedinophyceae sp. YPF-701]|nr:unnamed protein product [Pedinophyceae sp. YPF-701]